MELILMAAIAALLVPRVLTQPPYFRSPILRRRGNTSS